MRLIRGILFFNNNKRTPPLFMHFMHPTGSRRYAPTWSRMRSARGFVWKIALYKLFFSTFFIKFTYKTPKKRGGGLNKYHFSNEIFIV